MLSKRLKINDIHVLCYTIVVFLFGLGHTRIQNLNGIIGAFVTYGKFVPVFISAALLTGRFNTSKKKLAFIAVFLCLLAYNFWANNLNYTFFFIAYFMFACSNSSSEKIYKGYSLGIFSVIVLTLLLMWVGILENDNSYYGRYTLGFNYCTFGPNLFLIACLALVAWKKGRISFATWICILALNQYFYWRTNTDAVYLCVFAIFIIWLLLKSHRIPKGLKKNKVVSFLVSHCFIVCAIATIVFQLLYNSNPSSAFMVAMNNILSTRPIMGRNVFMRYGPGLGQIIKEILFGMGPDKATYLDSSYLSILTAYGAPLLISFCLALDITAKTAYKQDDLYIAFSLFVFAVHSITDPQIIELRTDPFIITALICLNKYWKYQRRIERIGNEDTVC